MPKLSVVIPTFNHALFIGEAIESVFKQTYSNFEVVVIDDGSTDNTKEIVHSFGKKVRYIYQENMGRGLARQHGVYESTGDYIAFLDSDDVWLPQKLERQTAYIKKNAFSGPLYAKIDIVDEHGKKIREENDNFNRAYEYTVRNNFSYESLLYVCPLFLSTIVAPKKLILDVGGFRSDYKVLEDFDFVLRLSRRHKIILLDEHLVHYRRHPGNAFKIVKKEVEKTYLSIFGEQLKYIDTMYSSETRRKAEAHIYNKLINFSYKTGNENIAFTYLKEFIKKQPLQIFTIRLFKIILKVFFAKVKKK